MNTEQLRLAIILDLRRRADIMEHSRKTAALKKSERAALYVAERALRVAAADYENPTFIFP